MTERSEAEMLHEVETANNGEGPDPIGTYSGEALQAILNALRERNDAHNGSTPRLRRRVLRVRPGLLGAMLGVTKQAAAKRYSAAEKHHKNTI